MTIGAVYICKGSALSSRSCTEDPNDEGAFLVLSDNIVEISGP